jgi:hypothetical protein
MYRKYTPEEKIKIVEGYIRGEYSWNEKVHVLGYKKLQDVSGVGFLSIVNMAKRLFIRLQAMLHIRKSLR